jgi:hypothetical protein
LVSSLYEWRQTAAEPPAHLYASTVVKVHGDLSRLLLLQ